jgi:hypothetical protein
VVCLTSVGKEFTRKIKKEQKKGQKDPKNEINTNSRI